VLKDEHMEFLWVRTIKWVRFPKFGFGQQGVEFDKTVDCLSELACLRFIIFQGRSFIIIQVVPRVGLRVWRT